MTTRDRDYIETRLLAPDVALGEAVERLRLVGENERAERLLRAQQALNGECRAVRLELFYPERRAT